MIRMRSKDDETALWTRSKARPSLIPAGYCDVPLGRSMASRNDGYLSKDAGVGSGYQTKRLMKVVVIESHVVRYREETTDRWDQDRKSVV